MIIETKESQVDAEYYDYMDRNYISCQEMHLKGRYFFTMYVIIICDVHVNNAQKNGKIKYH